MKVVHACGICVVSYSNYIYSMGPFVELTRQLFKFKLTDKGLRVGMQILLTRVLVGLLTTQVTNKNLLIDLHLKFNRPI